MSDLPLRFLHAADFQLDEPIAGLAEIPDHLRDALVDGSYQAAQRVIDTAISEQAAFVCLGGDVIDLRQPTARALAFLREQFRRLESAAIPVFWSCSAHGVQGSWPSSLPLPKNVHCFASGEVESFSHEDASGFNVKVLGRGGTGEIPAAEFSPPASGPYCVAVVSGDTDGQALAKRPVDYWALGGRHDRKTLFAQPTIAHYCGTPQSRTPRDIGPHGCTLVEVRRPRDTRLRFIPCDVVRCQHERVMVSAAGGWNDLQELLAQRVGEMRSQTPTIPLLVRWTLAAADNSVDAAQLSDFAAKSLTWLKKQYGYHSEPCWPVSVQVDAQRHIPASEYEEDTLLGDYLRAVRAVREQRQVTIAQSPCVPDQLPGDLQWLADLSDEATCHDVMREATGLGAALLRGEKAI